MCITNKELLEFEQIQVDLKNLKSKEITLRNKIIKSFRYADKLEGVQHKSIKGADIDIAITLKLTRTPDKDAIKTLWADFSQDEKDCIEYVPKLNLAAYKKLIDNGSGDVIMKCISEKPAQASVKLKFDE